MAFSKYIRIDIDDFAGDAFNRIAAAVDAWKNIFNAKARTGWIGRGNV